ncbi:DUF1801 domain-containing protein [Arthrobacter sp.]|uniref:iron chaperone n=1 Tax=Arthrobacter sp. TaxID=1667 RepID=UPI003395E3DA
MAEKFSNVDDYIASFPEDVQIVLQEVRQTIHNAVPGAGEQISYAIPAVMFEGHYLVYFAGWKHHVSLYPLPEADAALRHDMEPYVAAKGTLKFPLGKPIPYGLIARVAKALARQRGHDVTDA